MSKPKTPPENKSYYGGIYSYLMHQKSIAKKNKENPSK
jgi:hypothetical protein